MNLDANARAVALGGAYTALANDSNALLYNPAGLGRINRNEATFMHDAYVQGVSQEYLALGLTQGFGGSLNYLSFGNVTRTTINNPDGTLGTFGLSDLALSGGYGRRFLDDELSLGAGLTFLRESVDDASASGAALDAGALYSPKRVPGLALGLSLLNVGPDVKFASAKTPLPTTGRLGAAYRFEGLGARHTAALDVSQQRADAFRFGLGFESIVMRMMALRLGFTTRNDAGIGLTGGVGWAWDALAIDYAFSPYGDLGMAHRISLTYRWGDAAVGDDQAEARRRVDRNQRYNRSDPSEDPDRPGRVDRELPATASVHARFDRVDDLIADGRYPAALSELSRIDRALDPDDRRRVRYQQRLGLVAYKRDDCAQAKPHYVEALKQASSLGLSDSTVADAYAGMGLCLLAQGNDDYGGRFLRKALEAGPSNETRRLIELKLPAR